MPNALDKPKVRFIDYLLYYPFFVVIFITLCIFDVVQKVALLISHDAQQKGIANLSAALVYIFKIFGVKLTIEGNVDCDNLKPHIVIANHQSVFDIPALFYIFRKTPPKYVAKKELGKWIPGVSINLRRGGSVLIDRSNGKESIRLIKKFAERVKDNNYLAIIFPEGTRAKDGALKEFRYAGATSLIETIPNADIIPVTIDGSWKLGINKRGPIPFGISIKVVVGEPIKNDGKLTAKELIDLTYGKIRDTLEGIRGE